MPAGDRRGPMGMGPMSGRGAGYCTGYSAPGYMNPLPGYGFGAGAGRGRGFGRGGGGRGRGNRWGYRATGLPGWARGGRYPVAHPKPEEERQFLEEQMQMLQEQIDGIRERMEGLSKEEGESTK